MFVLVFGVTLITSLISGVIGMGGGLILMGVLSLSLPVTSAMILHGFTQMTSNGFRAFLHRKHIKWSVLPFYLIGAAVASAVLAIFAVIPSKEFILITLGLFPFVALLIPRSIDLDIRKKGNALLCGIGVTTAQVSAGASGPLLDVFYINSPMNRFEIIATKAMTQTIGHLIKLCYYGHIVYLSHTANIDFNGWLVPLAIVSAMAGTRLGKCILLRLSEVQFQKYSRFIVGVIGLVYLTKGLLFLTH